MILGDIAGVAAVALIALGLRELRAEHRPTIPIPLLAGLVLAIAATRVGAHGPIMFLDLAAVLVGAGGFIWASRRRTTEQRRAVAMPDARRLASIPGVGGNPQSVALSPDGRRVLVSLVRGRGGGLVASTPWRAGSPGRSPASASPAGWPRAPTARASMSCR